MKLNKIASLCKARKKVVLFDAPESGEGGVYQWIGDGLSAYPLHGLPRVDKDAILTIFNVAEKDRKDWTVKEMPFPDGLDVSNGEADEPVAASAMFLVTRSGLDVRPVGSPHGTIFLDIKYLDPLADVAKFPTLHIRESEDFGQYFAVKAGFLLEAIILPASDVLTDEFVEEIGSFAALLKEALRYSNAKKKEKEAREGEPEQTTMDGLTPAAENEDAPAPDEAKSSRAAKGGKGK
jgi:hypothetical protein